jgi:hypothetical protein
MIRHLAEGLRILGERWSTGLRRWAGAGDNWLDTGVRWALLAGALYVASHLLLGSWLGISVVVLVVGVKALRAATKAAKSAPPKAPVVDSEKSLASADEDRQDVPRGEDLALAHKLIGTAPGVHLAALAAALGPAWTIAHVRALAGRHQVPVRASVRDASRRVSPGVHRDDVPPLPEPLPEEAVVPPVGVVVAGQPGTTEPTTTLPATPTTRTIGGVRVTSTPDADNPHRTHVTVQSRPARR